MSTIEQNAYLWARGDATKTKVAFETISRFLSGLHFPLHFSRDEDLAPRRIAARVVDKARTDAPQDFATPLLKRPTDGDEPQERVNVAVLRTVLERSIDHLQSAAFRREIEMLRSPSRTEPYREPKQLEHGATKDHDYQPSMTRDPAGPHPFEEPLLLEQQPRSQSLSPLSLVELGIMRAAVDARSRQVTVDAGAEPDTANEIDVVDVSAFAPLEAPQGSEALVQIFLQPDDQAEAVTLLDQDDRRSGIATLATTIEREQEIGVSLDAGSFDVDEPIQRVTWRGSALSCLFFVKVPDDTAISSFSISAILLSEGVPLGSLRFKLRVVERERQIGELVIRGDQANCY